MNTAKEQTEESIGKQTEESIGKQPEENPVVNQDVNPVVNQDVIDIGAVIPENREKVMRRYAILSSTAYQLYGKGVEKAEKQMNEFLPKHDIIEDLSDDYSTTVYRRHENKPDDVIVAYRGTANLTDLAVDVLQIVPGAPLEKLGRQNTGYFQIAQDKFDAVKKAHPNANITTTGHSLGGSLAYYIGKTNNVKSYIFNAGSSPLDVITEKGINHTEENKATHYYVPADIVGASKAILGTDNDELVTVQPHKWLKDVAASIIGASLAGSIGGSIGGPIGSSLGAITGAGLGIASILDLHGLHNFLPTETFKDNLDSDDIVYKWIKPIDDALDKENRISNRGIMADFNKKKIINKREFLGKICNRNDPTSVCYKLRPKQKL